MHFNLDAFQNSPIKVLVYCMPFILLN